MTRETRECCAPLRLGAGASVLLWTVLVACGGTDRNKHHDVSSDGTVSTSAGGSSGGVTSAGGAGGSAGEAGSPSTDATSTPEVRWNLTVWSEMPR